MIKPTTNRWNKSLVLLSALFVLLLWMYAPHNTLAAVEERKPEVTINGKQAKWTSAQPVLYRGTTYVPLREMAEQLGAKVKWNTNTRAVELLLGGDRISHRPGTQEFHIEGYTITAVGPSITRQGTTMVPLRALADSLKADIELSPSPSYTVNLKPDHTTVLTSGAIRADQYLKRQNYSGIVLLAEHGELLLRKGYGYSANNKLNRPDQKSRIASLTKSFTAAAVMKLVEEGKLQLDDTLETYIPGFPEGDTITIHMLLSHTSGLTSNFPRIKGMTLEKTIEEIMDEPLQAAPGSDFKYSNSGYMILGSIIEQVTGMKYGDYLQELVFDPLGMRDTGEVTELRPKVQTIRGFVRKDEGWVEAGEYISRSGSGTLYSTVDDLLKWDIALNTEQILSHSSKELMFTPYSHKNYGYGWMIDNKRSGHPVVFHNGSGTGYSTGISRELGGGLTIILLGNQAGRDTLTMMRELRDLF